MFWSKMQHLLEEVLDRLDRLLLAVLEWRHAGSVVERVAAFVLSSTCAATMSSPGGGVHTRQQPR